MKNKPNKTDARNAGWRSQFGFAVSVFWSDGFDLGRWPLNIAPQSRVSPTLLPSALIASSVVWFFSAWVFYLTNRSSKDGVFGAPVWALLFLVLVPLISCLLAPLLVKVRRCHGERLQVVDYCALAAGVAPFAFVALLLLVLFITR
jgi:hypothetical protein